MKELLLLRHAKSSWESLVEDRNRSLTEVGVNRIKRMATACSEHFKSFEVVFSSPANRAMHTACIMMHQVQMPFEFLNLREQLYTFEVSQLINFTKSLPDHYSKVICVGHNPAFTQAVSTLSTTNLDHLPTASWAQIQFEQNEWEHIQNGQAQIGLPKDILK
jgi:phosphohistidine phosphatase|tara:strand:- start:3901 stop:4386 length:486 start_codon:yes stop_codon:yes gene_type:complete